MKKQLAILAFTGLVLTIAADAPADNAEYVTQQVPRVTGLQLVKSNYTGGPVPLELVVVNPNPKTLPQEQFTFFAPGNGVQSKTLDLKAGENKIPFTDPQGSFCAVKDYLGARGAGTTPFSNAKLRVTPSCTFATKIEDPWNQSTPDQVDYNENHDVYLSSVTVSGTPSCNAPLKVACKLVNHSVEDLQGMAVTLLDESGKSLDNVAALALPKGGSKSFSLTASSMPTGKVRVKLTGTSVHVNDRGWTIHVTPSCTLAGKKM